jgi:hypothetical protein
VREGPDLLLVGADGTVVLVRDFFSVESPPTLWTEGGARIVPELAEALAGPVAPNQFAQAGDDTFGEPIGRVETAVGTVTATRADGSEVTLEAGTPIYLGDVIRTGGDASVGVVFIDGSTFALDEKARLVMDEFVFDPGTSEGRSAFLVVQGVFTFVSGKIAESGSDAMTVETPVMTIGIRGTTVAGIAAADGATNRITLLSDGEIIVSTDAGARIMNQINQTTEAISFSEPPSLPLIIPASRVESLYGDAIQVLPPPPSSVQSGPADAGNAEAGNREVAEDESDAEEEEGADEDGPDEGAAEDDSDAEDEEGADEEGDEAEEGEAESEAEGDAEGGEPEEGGPEEGGPEEGEPEERGRPEQSRSNAVNAPPLARSRN